MHRFLRLLAALLLALPAALPASSADSDDSRSVLHIGALYIEKETAYYGEHVNVQETMISQLQHAMPDVRIDFRLYTIPELKKAVRENRVDAFISSSGFFVEMWPYGVSDLATLISDVFPDANHCVGGTFFVRADRKDLTTLESLQGTRLSTTNPVNFMAYQIGMAEIARRGFDPKNFFSETRFTRNNVAAVLEDVAAGRADAGVLRSCLLETLVERNERWQGLFRVVGPVGESGPCRWSTELYPGWVAAATKRIEPKLAEQMVRALFTLEPVGADRYRWSITTDYKGVNDIFRLLKTGPYAHLNEWTVRAVLERFWPAILLALVVLIGWILHWWSIEKLVRRRTAELTLALDRQAKLHNEAMASAREVEQLTKWGVVNELSCIYAHEMAQPLTSIGYLAGTLGLLARRTPADLKLIEQCSKRIEADLDVAQKILEQVRRYAKSPPKRNQTVDLAALVEKVLASVARSDPEREWRKTLPEHAFVKGDPLELRILILNLLRNALDAARAATSPEAPIEIRLETEDDTVVFGVENPGRPPLISTVAGRLVFERHGDEGSGGLGLGLLIVQSILKAHDGNLHFEPRDGSVLFEARLPRALEETDAADEAPSDRR